MQVNVNPDGRKVWKIRYTIDSKPKKTTGGTYPAVSLKDARAKRDKLKTKVSSGIDPIKEKQEAKEQKRIEEEQVKAENVVLDEIKSSSSFASVSSCSYILFSTPYEALNELTDLDGRMLAMSTR